MRVEERRVARRDDDVGVGDEVEPAAGARPVDRRDDRLPDRVVPRGEPELGPLRPAGLLAQRLGIAAELDDVEPGLERLPRAGVHDHADVGVGVELRPGPFQLVEHRGVHRVADVRSVELQPTDRTPPLDDQRLVAAHDGASRAGRAGRRGPCGAASRSRCEGACRRGGTRPGTLYGARCSRHAARSSSSETSAPPTMNATGTEPSRSSGTPDDARVVDAGHEPQHLLDVVGEHLVAAPVDHVADPALDPHEAVGVHAGQVAGVDEAVGVDAIGERRAVGVARGHRRWPHQQPAHGVRRRRPRRRRRAP